MKIDAVWVACWEEAWQAYCAGSIPIGAAVADQDGRILSTGANRLFEDGADNRAQISGSRLAHAEVNAILGVDFANVSARECVLYTTVEPCPLCIGAMAMAGIKELRFASRDPWAGSANLLEATPYLRGKRIQANGPECRAFETASVALNTDFLLRKDRGRFEKVVRAWDATCPEIASQAVDIFESGMLPALQKAGASADKVLTELEAWASSAAP